MPKSLQDEYHTRIQRLKKIREQGINPYPDSFDKRQPVADVLSSKLKAKVKTAGRLLIVRDMGKIAFAHVQDETGRVQLVFKEDELGKEDLKFFVKHFDAGDFIGVEGEVFKTQKGELSVLVKKYQLLGKALRPLPEKWHGLKDQEIKYRQRYLDLVDSRDTFDRFVFRSNFIKALREFYWKQGFHEVETPTFMHQATGATATPYKTHYNALGIDVFLRISHELPLKELIAGGFEKIFELGKAFRNEGIDPSHLPEHTHLEHYCAYWNYEDNIEFTEKMFTYLFKELKLESKMKLKGRDGKEYEVNWKTPWKRVDYIDLLKKETGLDVMEYTDAKKLLADIKKKKISFEGMDSMSLAGLVDNLYKKVVRPKIIDPVILYNYPKYLQPLARVNDEDDRLVDQFQLVVNGWELVKAYSELVDPMDQKERFDEQLKAKKSGADEVMEVDDAYILAMEHGMPPISGWGMGIDRTIALLTKQENIRDVVLFPLLRPEK